MSPPRIYVAHPITTYGSPHESARLRALGELLPGAALINPVASYANNSEWLQTWPRIIRTLTAVVAFGDTAGIIGPGVARELFDAIAVGIPVGGFNPDDGLREVTGVDLLHVGRRSATPTLSLRLGEPWDQGSDMPIRPIAVDQHQSRRYRNS